MIDLTQPQIERLSELPEDNFIVGEREGEPVVKRPDGRLICVQPDGKLALTTRVLSAQSYLDVERC